MLTAPAKLPQYKWLAQKLRGHIEAGALKPGARLPSWAEMQREYGVNKYTIERAQKLLAEEGLIICRQGSGTYVAELEPKPAMRKKGILGMCGKGFLNIESSPYWARLSYGIREASQRYGQHLLVLGHDSTDGWENADGLLLSDPSGALVANKVPPGLPCVSVLTPINGMCSVHSDDAAGIHALVRHLIELGHRKICYLHGLDGAVAMRRIAAFREAMELHGIEVPPEWMRSMFGLPQYVYRFDYGARFVETGRDNMARWLEDGWAGLGCTAILAHNDELALGIMEALAEAGLQVPEDVSVAGFDGGGCAERSQPALTTLEVPLEEIGQRSVELLLKQIQSDSAVAAGCVLPVTLRKRASTTVAPG